MKTASKADDDKESIIESLKKQLEQVSNEKNELQANFDKLIEERYKWFDTTLTNYIRKTEEDIETAKKELQEETEKILQSNLTSMPFLAGMVADCLTVHYQHAQEYLVIKSRPAGIEAKRIGELREETKEWIKKSKIAIYQLEYLNRVFGFSICPLHH